MTASFLTTRGGRLNYRFSGEGLPAFVFLHGFAGHAGFWQEQRIALSAGARVLAISWPGHGGSSWLPSSVDDLAADVTEAMKVCGVQRAVVVASSMGALPAIRLREAAPEKVAALFLAGGLPRFTAAPGYPAGLDAARIRKLAGQFDRDIPGVLGMFFRSLFTLEERSSPGYSGIRELMLAEPLPGKETLLAFLDMLQALDCRESLRRGKGLVHFLFGDQDPICPQNVFVSLKEICPSAVWHVFPRCAHFPFLSRPEAVNLLLQKLREQAG